VKGVRVSGRELRRLADELEESLAHGVDEARAWLDGPSGRRARAITARALLLATPLILRHPFFRTPAGRVVEVAGAAALVAKIAELIRDWEAAPPAGTAGFTQS